ncbi:hypothetical protein K435DRAFT_596501, partial [Dendrothele bispora CBS 962.96]
LKDEDIPHRTHIRKRILEIWHQYLDELAKELQNAAGKISMTMDCWSDPNLTPYMAVTSHWIS